MRAMPTSFGMSLSVAADWGATRSKLTLMLHTPVVTTAPGGEWRQAQGRGPDRMYVHAGSCVQVISARGVYSSATQRDVSSTRGSFTIPARCDDASVGVVVLVLQDLTMGAETGSLELELEVAHR